MQPQGAPPTNAKSLPGVPFALPRRPPTVHGTACSGTAPGPRSLAQIPDFIVTGQSPAQPKRITVLWVGRDVRGITIKYITIFNIFTHNAPIPAPLSLPTGLGLQKGGSSPPSPPPYNS